MALRLWQTLTGFEVNTGLAVAGHPAGVVLPLVLVALALVLVLLCRKLPGGEVTIKVGDNHMASIRCMSFKSNLAGMNPVEYPEMATVDAGTTVAIAQKQLKEMISRVVFAIATDESRQILTGCLLEVTAKEARLVALDGFRLAIQKVM